MAGNIQSIDDASGNGASPVWIVTLTSKDAADQHDRLVVKEEKQFVNAAGKHIGAFARGNIDAMNYVMTTVSPTAVMEVLEPTENLALDTFSGRPDNLSRAARQAWEGTRLLLKMKFDPRFYAGSNKPVDDKPYAMDENDRAKATHLLNGLRANVRAWQTLGQVVIADNLIGNYDRIAFESWEVTNFGNLIFSRDSSGNITHALGYDAVDPSSTLEKLLFGTNIDWWKANFGQYIKEKHTFLAASQRVINHINRHRMEPLGLAPFGRNVTANEVRYFEQGLVIGWDKLANAIGVKVRSGKAIPSGLMARARYLGWVR
ncbi:hypothetical protein [Xylophilus sp.]|uniref:hypothetical protein n=1 Tax=Xylophilus sp. TaxID=2653893 RepID=UPI002D80FCB0|nr:hypothetical protein [Xylophilus sp.]